MALSRDEKDVKIHISRAQSSPSPPKHLDRILGVSVSPERWE